MAGNHVKPAPARRLLGQIRNKSHAGSVFGVQCFYGFLSLETEQGEHVATFGAWLPDDAIHAVREWLDTVKFKKTAQTEASGSASVKSKTSGFESGRIKKSRFAHEASAMESPKTV
ncbi:hypothetical protein WJX77_007107 [Trebouxia sp. C0004]